MQISPQTGVLHFGFCLCLRVTFICWLPHMWHTWPFCLAPDTCLVAFCCFASYLRITWWPQDKWELQGCRAPGLQGSRRCREHPWYSTLLFSVSLWAHASLFSFTKTQFFLLHRKQQKETVTSYLASVSFEKHSSCFFVSISRSQRKMDGLHLLHAR